MDSSKEIFKNNIYIDNYTVVALQIYSIKEFVSLYPNIAAQYNLAEQQKGIIFFVPKGKKINSVLDLSGYLYNLQDSSLSGNIIFLLEKYSYLKIYDTLRVSLGLQERVIRCFLSQGSHLIFVYTSHNCKIKQNYSISFNLGTLSNLDCFMAITDCDMIKNDLTVVLEGKKAKADIKGLYLIDNNQKLYLNFLQKHKKETTFSDLAVHGVVWGQAQVKFKGNIVVEKDMTGIKASHSNKTLYFGDKATIESTPTLEIKNNDVQCKHASVITQIDNHQLFYLQSRGIDKKKAKELLIEVFFNVLIKSLDNFPLQEDIIKKIKSKMKRMDAI